MNTLNVGLPLTNLHLGALQRLKRRTMNGSMTSTRRVATGLFRAALTTLLVGTACGVQRGLAQATPPPIPNGLAKQRGCRDGVNPLLKIDPSWVSVQASDAPRVAEGVVRESHTATNDNPAFHVSHDWNADVVLDPAYGGLNSDGNPVENGERRMEIEWESAFFPPAFWPAPGDRAWMLGRWIFDCGHPNPYRSEIHPPQAVAFTRAEPVIFPGDARPSASNVTRVYIHGRGGYSKRPVVGQNYEFDVPLPSRPALPSTLRTAVLSLPFGGPSPILTLVPGSNPPKLHVRYPLAGVSDPGNTRRFGAVIAAAWQSTVAIPLGPGYRQLRVTFDSIRVNNDHDGTLSGSGEWRLWVRAGSAWFEVGGLSDVDGGDTVAIGRSVELIVPDNGAFEIQTSGWEDDCDDRFRRRDSDIQLWDASLGDLECEINGNDDIGLLERQYSAANGFGIGTHDDASARNGDADTARDFNLRYHVTLVKRFSGPGSTTGSLQVNIRGVPTTGSLRPVRVTGPGGFSQALGRSSSFSDLTPGVYTVRANEFTTGRPGKPICRLFTPTGDSQPVTVTGDGVASVTVGYTSAPCNQ